MRSVLRVTLVLLALVGLAVAALWWMVDGAPAQDATVGNANVLAAVFGLLALYAALPGLRRRPREGGDSAPLSAEQEQAVVERLAGEARWLWRQQAQLRGIRRGVAPVAVGWRWAGAEVGALASDFHRSAPDLLTEGLVTDLRSGLYDALPEGTVVVILGEPGSGKTGAAMALMLDVLNARRTDPDQPVPVLLSLGSWHPETPLLRWAATTIARDYRMTVPGINGIQVAAELINRGRLALFLDGLDELPESERGAALSVIDTDAGSVRVVLTSRKPEYVAALTDGGVGYAAVVELTAPDPGTVRDYLLTGLVGERRKLWQRVADYLADHPDSVLANAMASPLTLTLARQTYATSGDPTELCSGERYDSTEAVQEQLIERLLHQAYPQQKVRERALYWLSWLARRSNQEAEISWWLIPGWLPLWPYTMVCALLAGAFAGVVTTVAAILWFAPANKGDAAAMGWFAFLMVAITTGLTAWAVGNDGPTSRSPERGEPSSGRGREIPRLAPAPPRAPFTGLPAWRDLLDVGGAVLRGALIGGIVAVLVLFLCTFLQIGQSLSVSVSLGVAIVVGVATAGAASIMGFAVEGTVVLLSRPLSDAAATTPARAFAADRTISRLSTVIALIGCAVAAVLLTGGVGQRVPSVFRLPAREDFQFFVLWLQMTVGLTAGLAGVLTASLLVRPVVAVKLAEFLLWTWHGRRVRFRQLLDTAHSRHVLRQAGAVYQFRHAAIREHLAKLDTGERRGTLARPRAAILTAVVLAMVAGIGATTVAFRHNTPAGTPAYVDETRAAAFSPDGRSLAVVGTDRVISIIDVATGARRAAWSGHTGAVTAVAWARDGKTIASKGTDRTVRLWDTATGRVRWQRSLREPTGRAVALSADGTTLAVADEDTVRMWNLSTGAERSIDVDQKVLRSIWFASGTLLVTAGFDSVKLWHVATGARLLNLGSDIRGVDVSEDGSTLAYLRSDRISLLDMRTFGEIQSVPAPGYAGGILLAGDGSVYLAGAEIREVATGRVVAAWPAAMGYANAYAISPKGDVIAFGGDQRMVLWGVRTGQMINSDCLAATYRTDPRFGACV
jgi:hypothetical protein